MHPSALYTVGHSTRTFEALVAVLDSAEVRQLVDVRSVPRSRRHPQFDRETLERGLAAHEIHYRHEKALGGFRRPQPDSPNGGWEHPAFRGYADHMRSEEFAEALERLRADALRRVTCFMCAEAQWWRCHRRLIADALVVRSWSVLHLGLKPEPVPHELTAFAVVDPGGELSYPAPQGRLAI